jgi:hypothetical protein
MDSTARFGNGMAAGDALIFGFKSEQGCQFGFSSFSGKSEDAAANGDERHKRCFANRLGVRRYPEWKTRPWN